MGRPDWQCWPEGERCITCYRPVTDGELCPCGCGRMVCVEHRQPQHSPTPTPTPAPDHVGGATLLLGLWVPGADCHPDPDVIADVLTRTINEDRHRSDYLTRLGDIEVSAVPSPQWLTPESLAQLRSQLAGPSPAGTPETNLVAAKEPQCGDPYHRHTGGCFIYAQTPETDT